MLELALRLVGMYLGVAAFFTVLGFMAWLGSKFPR